MKRVKFRANRDMTVEELLKENGISRKIIKSLKAKGNIRKDEKIIYLSKMIDEGDFITLIFDDQESSMTPVDIPIKIAYKDDDMMVIDKDYGLSVMSTINLHEDTLLNALQYYLIKNNINSKIHIVNRLDRNTTGLMVVAFNRLAASFLNSSLKDTLKRRYYAIVKGILDEKEGIIKNKIVKESEMTVRRCVRNDGKDAITKYKVVKEFKNYSLLDIELLTGRTHQIRVTFSTLGHPLVGDDFYDPDYKDGEELMLHSHYIEFIRPSDKKYIELDTGISDRLQHFIDIEINLIKNTKHEHLIWTADELALIATDVDEVIFGANWLVSKSCKSIARTCELFMIPQIRMMRGEKKVEIEESKDVQEYRKKHHITVVWKE